MARLLKIFIVKAKKYKCNGSHKLEINKGLGALKLSQFAAILIFSSGSAPHILSETETKYNLKKKPPRIKKRRLSIVYACILPLGAFNMLDPDNIYKNFG